MGFMFQPGLSCLSRGRHPQSRNPRRHHNHLLRRLPSGDGSGDDGHLHRHPYLLREQLRQKKQGGRFSYPHRRRSLQSCSPKSHHRCSGRRLMNPEMRHLPVKRLRKMQHPARQRKHSVLRKEHSERKGRHNPDGSWPGQLPYACGDFPWLFPTAASGRSGNRLRSVSLTCRSSGLHFRILHR